MTKLNLQVLSVSIPRIFLFSQNSIFLWDSALFLGLKNHNIVVVTPKLLTDSSQIEHASLFTHQAIDAAKLLEKCQNFGRFWTLEIRHVSSNLARIVSINRR